MAKAMKISKIMNCTAFMFKLIEHSLSQLLWMNMGVRSFILLASLPYTRLLLYIWKYLPFALDKLNWQYSPRHLHLTPSESLTSLMVPEKPHVHFIKIKARQIWLLDCTNFVGHCCPIWPVTLPGELLLDSQIFFT